MLEYAIKKAKEAADHYEMYALDGKSCTRKCEKTFLWTGADFAGKTIGVLYLPADMPEPAMHGTCIVKSDTAFEIILKPGLPPALERFILCKELFEVILGFAGTRQMDLLKHLETTLFWNGEGSLPLHAAAELVTPIAAGEFLFPHAHREKIIANGGRDDIAGIAKQYDIPESIVEMLMSAHAMARWNPDKQD